MAAWQTTCIVCGKDEAYYDTHEKKMVCCNPSCGVVLPDKAFSTVERLTARLEEARDIIDTLASDVYGEFSSGDESDADPDSAMGHYNRAQIWLEKKDAN